MATVDFRLAHHPGTLPECSLQSAAKQGRFNVHARLYAQAVSGHRDCPLQQLLCIFD
jgi:hypothetical protein